VRFSPREWSAVVAAADRDGLAVGAWVGYVACRVAAGRSDDVPVAWAEVVREVVRERSDLLALTAVLETGVVGKDVASLLVVVRAAIQRLDEFLDIVVSTAPP